MIKPAWLSTIQKALDGSALRHTVISNNLANINTPGFKKSEVSFQAALEETLNPEPKLKRTRDSHFPAVINVEDSRIIQVQQIQGTTLRNDGNNVDMDMELAALAENNLYFNSLAQLLSSQLSLIKTSINEGKR